MAKNPAKNPTKIHGKNLLKIPCGQKSAWITQKSFMISLTKNLLKILNNNKKPLILPNKTKTP